MLNAFGDPFLTDAFSAGHLFDKRDVMEKFNNQLPTTGQNDSRKFTSDSKNFFAAIAKMAFAGDVAREFSKYGKSLALVVVLTLPLLGGCKMRSEQRLLAMGGVHALEAAEPCQLTRVEPAPALLDLAWKDALVVRAGSEGQAELTCGNHRVHLQIVKPARLDLVLVDDHVKVGQRFQVRAVPRDRDGRELEVGKWSEIAWPSDGAVASDTDASAGEFGVCSTCFGMHGFRATAAGPATIEARLGEATGTLKVTAQP